MNLFSIYSDRSSPYKFYKVKIAASTAIILTSTVSVQSWAECENVNNSIICSHSNNDVYLGPFDEGREYNIYFDNLFFTDSIVTISGGDDVGAITIESGAEIFSNIYGTFSNKTELNIYGKVISNDKGLFVNSGGGSHPDTPLIINQYSGVINGKDAGVVANVNYSFNNTVTVNQMGGEITSSDGSGIYLYHDDMKGNGLTIVNQTSGKIYGGEYGVRIKHYGGGGVFVKQSSGEIIGEKSGIYIQNPKSDTNIDLFIAGRVYGGTDAGILIEDENSTDTSLAKMNIVAKSGSDISSSSGVAIQNKTKIGANVTLEHDSKITGSIYLGDGGDTLSINYGADVTGITILDGGIGQVDTIDTLNINESIKGSSVNAGIGDDISIVNWDVINIGNNNITPPPVLTLSSDLDAGEVNIASGASIKLSSTPMIVNINGRVNSSGIIDLTSGSDISNILKINGDYAGYNGKLVLNAELNDDNSSAGHLIVNGSTSGHTSVVINNLGGTGSTTVEGIEIVTVNGISDGIFIKSGRIVAGAYDYSLVRGAEDKSSNWYLTSQLAPTNPVEPPVTPPTDPVTPPTSREHMRRPEGGSYITNQAMANILFNTRLHDRLGETHYVDALTGEEKVSSLWLRQKSNHNRWRDSSAQLKTSGNNYVTQIGGDVAQWSDNGLERGHLGLMVGYANGKSKTRSSLTGYGSKSSLNGYSIGIYGSWFASDKNKAGLYVDSWLQYNWFNNHVNGEKLASESYKSKGLTASLETGYTLKMGEVSYNSGTVNEWFIQPQAQTIWMGVKADTHHEHNGTRISSKGDGNVQTRLGMRVFLKSHHIMDEGKDRAFEPFIEVNWLHNIRDYSVKMDDVSISQNGARNIGEVKTGVEGQLNANLSIWGNVGVQMGDKSYNNSMATIGVKYSFK